MKRLFAYYIFWCLFSYASQAQKTDTIYLFNGDRITGELKKCESGLITLKTDAMQTLSIETKKVSTVYSTKRFEFRTKSGIRYFGSILKGNSPGSINVVTTEDTSPKPLWDIVTISPIRQRFVQRIDGSIDIGLSYTKSIDVFQYNINGWTTYRSTNYSTRVELSSIFSEAGDGGLSRNNDLGVNVTRYLPKKWFARVQIDGQQNTELNLEHRFQAGPAVGYDLVRTSPLRIYGLGGVLFNQEQLIEPSEVSINVEGLISLYFDWYRWFRHPKIDISSEVDVYPSFTVSGRVRLEYDLSVKYEILTDVFLNLTYYQNFDSKPDDTGGSSKNDYGIITSIGYTF